MRTKLPGTPGKKVSTIGPNDSCRTPTGTPHDSRGTLAAEAPTIPAAPAGPLDDIPDRVLALMLNRPDLAGNATTLARIREQHARWIGSDVGSWRARWSHFVESLSHSPKAETPCPEEKGNLPRTVLPASLSEARVNIPIQTGHAARPATPWFPWRRFLRK